jgi:hypothetical protein
MFAVTILKTRGKGTTNVSIPPYRISIRGSQSAFGGIDFILSNCITCLTINLLRSKTRKISSRIPEILGKIPEILGKISECCLKPFECCLKLSGCCRKI